MGFNSPALGISYFISSLPYSIPVWASHFPVRLSPPGCCCFFPRPRTSFVWVGCPAASPATGAIVAASHAVGNGGAGDHTPSVPPQWAKLGPRGAKEGAHTLGASFMGSVPGLGALGHGALQVWVHPGHTDLSTLAAPHLRSGSLFAVSPELWPIY